jgi:hypothetical protein
MDKACVAMLQAIMSGTAVVGDTKRNKIAPATAEKANPEKPDTTAPRKTAATSAT